MIGFRRRKTASFRRDERGVIAIIAALTLPVVMGMMALAVDMGQLAHLHGQLQHAADSAALAGASAVSSSESTAQSRAVAFAGKNMSSNLHGTVLTSGDVVVGNWVTDTRVFTAGGSPSNAVQVTTRRAEANGNPVNLFFAKFMGYTTSDVSATAIAYQDTSGEACVLALNGNTSGAITNQGDASINMSGCQVAANSTDSSAINLVGSSTLSADCAYTAGGISTSGGGTLSTTCASSTTNGSAVADPYADLDIPSFSGCDQNNFSDTPSSTTTLNPGTYCNGMTLKGDVTLNPGTYIIDRGSFKVNSTASVTGTGVTIILTSSTGSDFPTVTVNGAGTITLSAPTDGDFAGILFYQDPNAPSTGTNKFNGGSWTDFTGVLYFPSQEVQFTGGNETGGACTQIVADTITFSGNANLNNTCDGTGVNPIGLPGPLKLVS